MTPKPPRLAQWLLDRALPRGPRGDTVRGDLLEELRDRSTRTSPGAARRWYGRQAVAIAARRLLSRRASETDSAPTRAGIFDAWSVDLRSAWRSLVKARGFSVAATLTLALGIGATTAVFSVVDAVLLRPFPFADPNRIMWLNETATATGETISIAWPDFLDWQTRLTSFVELASVRRTTFNITGVGDPERVPGRRITSGFFTVLGVRPALGRLFTADEDTIGAPALAVLTHSYWHERFGDNPHVLGQTITVDDEPTVIIGVLPAGFRYNPLTSDALYLSLGRTATANSGLPDRGNHNGLSAIGLLRPGVTVEAARAELDGVEASFRTIYRPTNATVAGQLMPVSDRLANGTAPVLETVFGAVTFLLLLAAVNVASLLVARSMSRRRELALKAALGCGRGRLIRQLFAESAILSVVAGALGLLLSAVLIRVLIGLAPPDVPRLDEARMDGTVWLFTLLASGAAAIVLAVFPAIHSSGVRGQHILVRAARGDRSSAGGQRVRRALLVVEIALAVILITGAGLMMRTMNALGSVDPGFKPDHLMTVRFFINGDTSTPEKIEAFQTRIAAFYDTLEPQIRALPGISSATFALAIPIDGAQWNSVFIGSGLPIPDRAALPSASMIPATAGYFETFGIPLRSGRLFDGRDSRTSAKVAIINEQLARTLWPHESAVGKRLKQGWPEDIGPGTPWRAIVGVVGDVKLNGVDAATPLEVYMPMSQSPSESAALVVRTTVPPGTLAGPIRAVLHQADPQLPIGTVQTMDELMAGSIARRRMTMLLLTGFAGLALILASIGLYGVVSQGVSARTREIGLRLALGATARQVVRLFVTQGLAMTGVGLAVGVLITLGLSRLVESEGLLFQVKATDPATLWSAAAALLAVSLAACYVPARRASRVSPSITLTTE